MSEPVRRPLVPLLAALAVLLVVAAVVVGVVLGRGDDEPAVASGTSASAPADVLTPTGYDALLDAVRGEQDGTEAFALLVRADEAFVDLPRDATSQRSATWRWDGELTPDSEGSTGAARFDLADLDVAVLRSLVDRAEAEVEEPTGWTVDVSGPRDPGGDAIRVSVLNAQGDSAVVVAALDGTVRAGG
ncbi:hypothetical protein [Nocardioides lianchengensis]|uniref:Uncharacterized protein n=1 Tax=Nocardioides lianchengensis TaxID=1045774 RepID=A0A1G6ZFW3_9ACTN|nr:hypothetical protein [Nocardioides lianchengensis]NYG11391.1 hypothetical protein [Nocardioides lianchengensis]SDE01574.1 hypothetical protein SAMN05421872_113134 [Nocardioides lianchengensis]